MKRRLLLMATFLLLAGAIKTFAASMAVSSVTITQVKNISGADTFALLGMRAQPVLKIDITTTGSGYLALQSIVIKSLNQDNTDIDSIAIYQSFVDHFSFLDYEAADFELLDKRHKLTGDTCVMTGLSATLNSGHNYFWVTMDVKKTAKVSHTLDASIRAGGMQIGGTYLWPATAQSPADNVPIANIYFSDNFNTLGNWTQKQEGTTDGWPSWGTNYGGYGIGTPLFGHPTTPKSGSKNAMLVKEATNPFHTWLISKPLDLSLSVKPTLVFYHSQVLWLTQIDELEVYYRVGAAGTWNLLHSYILATPNEWIKREIILPDAAVAKNVYLGFRGKTNFGYGTCVDSLVLFESKVIQREVNSIEVTTPSVKVVPQGAAQSPVLRTNIRIRGNTNPITLDQMTVTSLNTNDGDVKALGARLFYTSDSVFLNPVQCGSAVSITSGKMVFTGLSKVLETGDNYFWVTYDATDNATIGNTLDAKILQDDIKLSVTGLFPFPATDESPDGSRKIKQSIFFDDFENNSNGWSFSGEFVIGTPSGLGGGSGLGLPDPTSAYSGTGVIGTDLAGTGLFPGNYEPNLDYATGYTATSKTIDGTYFKNINLSFSRWLNVDNLDSALIEYQYDGETNWRPIWHSSGYYTDTRWYQDAFDVSSVLDRKKFKLRFRLGYSNGLNNFSGWNIDYLFVTADSVKNDASVTKYYSPNSACGLTANEHIKVQIKNTGPKVITNLPILFSTDKGATFTSETIPGPIAVDGVMDYTFTNPANFSKAAIYNIVVKVAYPTDDYDKNDTVLHNLMALPTITLPYHTGFEEDTSFWVAGGLNSSWKRGNPSGSYINFPIEGSKCWKTSNYGVYNQYENSFIESSCFNFTGNEKPVIDFKANYYSTAQMDGAILQYSTDGTTWQTVLKDAYAFPWDWYNDTVVALRTRGWTGQSVDAYNQQKWTLQRQLLPAALAGQSNVRLRFVFKSDSTTALPIDGIAFDDLRVLEAPHDAGIVSIDNLTTPSCQFDNPELLKVTIKNYGIRDMLVNDTMIVGVKVNQAATVIDTFLLPVALPVGQSKQFTLHKKIDLSKAGVDTVRAFTLIEKEPYFYNPVSNDMKEKIITINLVPVTGLADSLVKEHPELERIQATDSSYFLYQWTWGAKGFSTSYLDVANTGIGMHYLTITNSITNCKTTDSIKVSVSIFDVGVTSIVSPVNNCGYGTAMHPTVEITNFGNDTLRAKKKKVIPVYTKLNNGTVMIDSIHILSDVPPHGKYTATLDSTSLNLSTAGLYDFKAYTKLFADPNTLNDTATALFQIYGYPFPNLGADVKIEALQTTLDAGNGYVSYLWSKDATPTQTLNITESGNYSVIVTDGNTCPGTDTVNVFFAIRDLAVKRLVSPVSACSLPGLSTVACKIVNLGSDTIKAGAIIDMSYSVKTGSFVHENFTLPANLYSNDSIAYTFAATVDLSAIDTYPMRIVANVTGDLRRTNDTLHTVVYAHGDAKVKLGDDVIITAAEFRLCPGPQFKNYLWQNNSTDSAYVVSQTNYEASNRYIVKITDIYDCQGADTIFVSLKINDLGILGLTPVSTCPVVAPQELSLTLGNTGNLNIINPTMAQNVKVTYWFNDETTAHIEKFAFDGSPSVSATYKLNSLLDLSKPGVYKVFTSIQMTDDVRSTNDTLTTFITVNGPPAVSFGAANDTLKVALPYTLDPGYVAGYLYKWQDNSTAQTFTVNKGTEGVFSVAITDVNTCTSIQKVVVMDRINDLAVTGLTIPYSSCKLPGTQQVGVHIKNTGTLTLLNEPVTIKYKLNDGTEYSKDVIYSGNRDTVRDYYFDGLVDLSLPSSYNFKANLTAAIDEISTNNSGEYYVNVWGKPKIDFGATLDTIKAVLPIVIDPRSTGYSFTYTWQDQTHAPTYNVTKSGLYTVNVMSIINCDSTRSVYVKDITQVTPPVNPGDAVGDLSDNPVLVVYPNPAHDMFNIDLTVKNNNPVSLELTNSVGVWVLSKKLPAGSLRYFETVDVSQLPKGIYYLRVSQLNRTFVKKILVQ